MYCACQQKSQTKIAIYAKSDKPISPNTAPATKSHNSTLYSLTLLTHSALLHALKKSVHPKFLN